MVAQQQFDRDGPDVRRYEYEQSTVVAADLGPGGDGSVDLVDGTAIVVVGDEQYDVDLPDGDGDSRASIRNGVLTIEVEQ